MRLIDADAIKYPDYYYSEEASPDPFIEGFHQGKIDAICEIKALTPTIDPASLRIKSEWEITDIDHAYGDKCYHCPECGEDEWRDDAANFCPECGEDEWRDDAANFCPNCGADMRGTDNGLSLRLAVGRLRRRADDG